MRDSSATDKTRLLSPLALLLVAIAVGAVLWLSFKDEDVFRPQAGQPDEVSANYAELLLKAHPQDNALRIQLVELLLKLGDPARAREHLLAWPQPDRALQSYYLLEVDAAAQFSQTAPGAQAALLERLMAVDYPTLAVAQLQRLATLALALQAPGRAAEVFDVLAKRDAPNRTQWLKSAAQWHLASGQPGRAADIYLQFLRDSQDSAEHALYRQQAVTALLGADQGERALQVLEDELDSLDDPQLLEQGINLAVSRQRLPLARVFFDKWRSVQPDSPEVLEKSFKLRLVFADLDGAWSDGQALLQQRPDDTVLLEQMARLGEWRGDTGSALDYWIALLKRQEDPQVRTHAQQLALQRFDFERAIPLLGDVMKQRALSEEELDSLIYAHESLGTPEQAETWLRSYLRKYPRQRRAWVQLLQNLENTGQYPAKAQAWKNMARAFTLTPAERVDWSSTYLKLFDARSAWQVLDVDTRAIKDLDFWQARANVAWELELDEPMRQALERILALGGKLDHGDESLLVSLYRDAEPRKALAFMTSLWQRDRQPARLVAALQLAQELEEWEQVATLLEQADEARFDDQPLILASRGALAMHRDQRDQAQAFYREGLERFPDNNLFRERLLWLYVDAGDVEALKPLVRQWRVRARGDSLLWLPMASASQMTGQTSQALAWYRLYLAGNDQDWLVRAAYADALQAAGYHDQAQRLRLQLSQSAKPETLKSLPQSYRIWLRLMASSYSPRLALAQARRDLDGSPAMLQLWFERLLAQFDATHQEPQKDAWLAWARQQGLHIDRYEQIQEALRNDNRASMERMLAGSGLDPAQRVEMLNRLGRSNQALNEGLSALGEEQPQVIRDQLLRQNIEMLERNPQGAQVSFNQQDFGGLEFNAVRLSAAHNLGEHWYASAQLEQGRYHSDLLDAGQLGQERNLLLGLQRQVEDGSYKLLLDSSLRDDHDRQGLGLSRTWLLGRDDLSVGLDWHRKSEESGLMRALGQQDSLWVSGRHRFSARDQLNWNLAQRAYSTRDGDSLGNGQVFKLEYNHTLQFEGPNWILRGGVDYQRNSLSNRALDGLSSLAGGPVIRTDNDAPLGTADLLQSRYGQLYVGSSWRRGFPGALNRTRAQYTWLVDTSAGWQWMDKTFNYGISTGIGIELFGDDELAVTVGYQSAPQTGNGEAGGTFGVSYGLRFGR